MSYHEFQSKLSLNLSQIQHDAIITDAILIQKAIGWLDKFKKRFGIAMKTFAGESGRVNIDIVELER